MASLVSELKRKAKDPNFPISELLWDAKKVAKKIGDMEFDKWIDNELNGYTNSEVPDYRKVDVKIVCKKSSADSWRHLDQSGKLDETFSPITLDEPIDEIITRLNNNIRHFKVSGESLRILHNHFSEYMFMFEVSSIQINRVVNNVRNKVLNLAFELENKGLLTEEIILPEKETKVSEQKSHSNIVVHGNIYHSGQDMVDANGSNNLKIATGNATQINLEENLKIRNPNENKKSEEYPRLNIFLAVIGLIIATMGVYLTYLQYLK